MLTRFTYKSVHLKVNEKALIEELITLAEQTEKTLCIQSHYLSQTFTRPAATEQH